MIVYCAHDENIPNKKKLLFILYITPLNKHIKCITVPHFIINSPFLLTRKDEDEMMRNVDKLRERFVFELLKINLIKKVSSFTHVIAFI